MIKREKTAGSDSINPDTNIVGNEMKKEKGEHTECRMNSVSILIRKKG